MFAKNVGSIDKILRLVAGIVLIGLALFSGLAQFESGFMRYAPIVVGAVLIFTSLINSCPLYSLLGMSTRKS